MSSTGRGSRRRSKRWTCTAWSWRERPCTTMWAASGRRTRSRANLRAQCLCRRRRRTKSGRRSTRRTASSGWWCLLCVSRRTRRRTRSKWWKRCSQARSAGTSACTGSFMCAKLTKNVTSVGATLPTRSRTRTSASIACPRGGPGWRKAQVVGGRAWSNGGQRRSWSLCGASCWRLEVFPRRILTSGARACLRIILTEGRLPSPPREACAWTLASTRALGSVFVSV